jgi:MFS family permease
LTFENAGKWLRLTEDVSRPGPQVDEAAPNAQANGAVEYDELHIPYLSHTTERALVTKIDFRVVPFLCILYVLAFLDRVNIANARSFGLATDLGLTGVQYNTALTIFFVPYVVFEIPSNILMKKLNPHIWLSGCMFMFGLVSVLQGLVQNFSGLLATRFFLGFFEAGTFPGCFYLIGMWYKRSEAQRRYSFFFSSTTVAGAFGGLLAAAIGQINYGSYHGWRWVFIIEGCLTCVVALAVFFLIPSFPEQARWLTEEERAYVKSRLQVDQGRSAAARQITVRDVGQVFKDYKVFLGGLMYFGLIVPAYGYAFFAPSIINSYGYSAVSTQLHSVPPWACAFGFSMLIAFASDKLRHRFLFALLPICVSITGFGILIVVHDNLELEYAALFLVAMGTYSAMPVIICWFSMNLGGHHRRAVGTAWQIGFGNTGGIIATYAFLQSDLVNFYHMGYSICIAFACLSAASCCAYAVAVTHQNRLRDRMPVDVGLTEYEKAELGVSLHI